MTASVLRRRAGRLRLLLPVGLAVVAVGLVPAPPAHAISAPGGWSLEPTAGHGVAARTFLQYVVAEGQVVHDSVTLTNPLHHRLTVDLYAANAYNVPNGGAFALEGSTAPKTGVASWISLPTSRLTVPARTSARIPVTIRIPQQASPGELAAGVVALDTKAELAQRHGNVRVSVREALGVRVYLQIAGPLRPGLAITNVNVRRAGLGAAMLGGGKSTVSYDVMNTGNTRLNATATAKIVDEFGRTVHTFPPASLLALLPGARVTLDDPWTAPRIGRFRVEVNVTSGTTTGSGQSVTWIVPWLAVILLAVVAGGVFWQRRRRRHREPDGGGPDTTPSPLRAVDEPANSGA